jgi:galactose-3-O-sulfotransferase 2
MVIGNSLETFAMDPNKSDFNIAGTLNGRNTMLWDFGFDVKDFENDEKINEKIREIEETFDLVMIAEHFNESMVLLKDLLCWDYISLTSLKLNAQSERTKSQVSNEGRRRLKQWLSADYKLYQHFNMKFDEKVKQFGLDKMAKEKIKIEKINQDAEEMCVISHVPNQFLKPGDRVYGAGTLGYNINPNEPECEFLAKPEIQFSNLIRNIQTKRAAAAEASKIKS